MRLELENGGVAEVAAKAEIEVAGPVALFSFLSRTRGWAGETPLRTLFFLPFQAPFRAARYEGGGGKLFRSNPRISLQQSSPDLYSD